MRRLGIIWLLLTLMLCGVANESWAFDQKQALLQDENNTISVFRRVAPLVVNIYRVQRIYNMNRVQYVRAGAGSGFFWDHKGHVVTNYHVVRNAHRIAVSIGRRGKAIPAKIVGIEPRKDIAVLQLGIKNPEKVLKPLQPMKLADSNKLMVGQKTIAIGNPYGLDRTLTTGVISAVGRRVSGVGGVAIYDMVQTDASINPGNSGGPLVNSSGELIGMNTIIFSRSGASAGIGFAVPANTINRIVNQIIQYGEVIRRGFGIQILDERISSQLSVPGLIIGNVIPGTPAALAGLKGTYRDDNGEIKFGDVIVAVHGKRVTSFDDFYNIMEQIPVGTMVEVKYIRDKKLRDVTMKTINVSLLR